MKLIIAGSRTIKDNKKIIEYLDRYRNRVTEIVSGGALGPDFMAIEYAMAYNIPYKVFKPDWEKYGKSAGMIRNIEMLKYADHLIAFWDGQSKGTKQIIDNASKYGVHCITVMI